SHNELVAEAEAEKRARIDAATSRIVVWQTKLLMGRKLTDDEFASLNAWMDYIDALTAIDISTAPDIEWLTPPGEQAS
ncbi:TPA: tail fiber assembly protein, partial [Citrobacter braakii]